MSSSTRTHCASSLRSDRHSDALRPATGMGRHGADASRLSAPWICASTARACRRARGRTAHRVSDRTATLRRYDRRLGWAGMVLTHPDYRRRGFARALLEHVVEHADALRIESLKLDATDQGQPLYESLGFRMEQVVERWWRRGDSEAPRPHDRGQLAGPSAGMDLEAFGVDRSRLFQGLSEQSAVFASSDGFAFLRPGVRASYAGPCVARNAEAARGLLEACIREADR